jgi:hypothetical protein
MKLQVFLIFLFIVSNHCISAQNSDTTSKRNFVYAELLGKGGYYSINYERRFLHKSNHNLNIHLGFAYPVGPNFVFKNSILVVPFSIYYSFGRKIQLEAGLGINQYLDFDPMRDYYREKSKFYSIYYSPTIGVRFEFKHNFFLRAQYCPQIAYINKINKIYFSSWLGISMGFYW